MREAIRGHQRPSEAIRGHQRRHQRGVISGPPACDEGSHQRGHPSHHMHSQAIAGAQRPTADGTGQHEHAARLEGLESLEGLG